LVTAQLRKASEKATEDTESKKQQSEKKYLNQIEQLKENTRTKCDEYEDNLRRTKEELRVVREKLA
jgi:hypothetical protein